MARRTRRNPSMNAILLFGGVGALVWWLWSRSRGAAAAVPNAQPRYTTATIGGRTYPFTPIKAGTGAPAEAVGIINVAGESILVDKNGNEVRE